MMNTDGENKLFSYYSSVKESEIEWLWYPYIPYGKITIVEGDPGEGKSTFMLHVAALLTKGKPMPDGVKSKAPMTVIYQCSEDDISDTIKPRLKAAGADCDRVAFIEDNGKRVSFEDSRVEATIKETNAKLVIFDPLQSFLSQDSDIHNAGKMRTILGKLSIVAARYHCAIVIIGHMNKSNTGKNLYRGLGSIDITAIARSVLMVARDLDDSTLRYMFPIKSNLAPEGPAIGFRFDRKRGFRWIGPCKANVDTETVEPYTRGAKGTSATAVIISMLRNGPTPSAEIFDSMKNLGLSERSAYKIKSDLGIESYKDGNIWYWKFKDDEDFY